jgi:gamma-glutamylcyclotransferase (GGCT)/AIG2-like uncharacterized protein YtfP
LIEPHSIFVYGTLKRGQVRERCWPRRPTAVESATVRGALYDLGKYPALIAGEDTITGELWHLSPDDLAETLTVLDRVEGFAGRSDDLYRREIIDCHTAAGSEAAWTYVFFQAHRLLESQRIQPDKRGLCRWPPIAAQR